MTTFVLVGIFCMLAFDHKKLENLCLKKFPAVWYYKRYMRKLIAIIPTLCSWSAASFFFKKGPIALKIMLVH